MTERNKFNYEKMQKLTNEQLGEIAAKLNKFIESQDFVVKRSTIDPTTRSEYDEIVFTFFVDAGKNTNLTMQD